MLLLVYRESRNGLEDPNYIVLNTDYMSELRVYQSTKAIFRYFRKPEDRRGGDDYYVVSETKAAVQTEMDKAYSAISIELDVYKDNDPDKATIATSFNVKEIVRAYPDTRSDKTKCWIEVNEKGWWIRKYLVAHYYVNLPGLASTGTTTSTTSTTSTTTTEALL